jgi:hypothetical protein
MRPKFQKQSVLKLIGRIILYKRGYNTPPLGAELGSRAYPGVYTRDLEINLTSQVYFFHKYMK